MKITVKSTQTVSRQPKDATKQPNVFQPVLFEPGNGAVYPAEILIRNGEKAHEVGQYELSPDSFYTGDYGKIQFRIVLGEAIKPSSKAAA